MIKDQVIKIADFGLAKVFDDGEGTISTTVVGTYNYMAPEILSEEKTRLTKKCDVWSLGVTIFELVAGYLPF